MPLKLFIKYTYNFWKYFYLKKDVRRVHNRDTIKVMFS